MTDWRPPSGSTLARLPDQRVRQFWDPNHIVSEALKDMARDKPPQPNPECCRRKGVYWDDAIVFAPGARWEDRPVPAFWNGPVVRIIPGLEQAFKSQLSTLKGCCTAGALSTASHRRRVRS